MAYKLTVLIIINSPDDYLAWSASRKVLRWNAVIRWHEYIADLHAKGYVPWSWGSHQLISKFSSSPIVSTHVAIYQCDSLEEFSKLLETDPLREQSSYITIPLLSLEQDFVDEVSSPIDLPSLPSDNVAVLAQQASRGLYFSAPNFAAKSNDPFVAPPNPVAAPDARADGSSYVSYLLVGHGAQASTTMNDLQRKTMEEKVTWWHGYASQLIQAGKITHGWANGVLCHPGNPVSNQKGSSIVYQDDSPEDLTRVINANPLGEQADLISVVLRPLGDQKISDAERLALATEELKREQQLNAP